MKMQLRINIHVGEMYVPQGFEIIIKPVKDVEPLVECLLYLNFFVELFGLNDVRRLAENLIGEIKPRLSQYYIESRKSIYAYEILQVLKYIYSKIPNKFKVVDFNDVEIAQVKTMKDAIIAFKNRYPYMDNNLIKNFIYEI